MNHIAIHKYIIIRTYIILGISHILLCLQDLIGLAILEVLTFLTFTPMFNLYDGPT